MSQFSRRAILAAAAAIPALSIAPAHAALPSALANHPGFRAWQPTPANSAAAPLNAFIETEAAPKRLRDWLDGRPAVLALWATWCGPCLVEKPGQAEMARRLERAGARARIMPLLAYDRVTMRFARRTLDRLQARDLPLARASDDAERGFIRVFGPSPLTPDRTSMPSLLLLDAQGRELGRAVGTMTGPDGETDYWEDESSFDFLSRL
jgi:thiol-disulfide isomerase/thioredoxin